MIKEGKHLFSGIGTLVVRKILVIFEVLDQGQEIRNLQAVRSRTLRYLAVIDIVCDHGDLNEDRNDHILISICERREREPVDHVRIRSEELVQTEIFIEISGDRVPPVKEEVLK